MAAFVLGSGSSFHGARSPLTFRYGRCCLQQELRIIANKYIDSPWYVLGVQFTFLFQYFRSALPVVSRICNSTFSYSRQSRNIIKQVKSLYYQAASGVNGSLYPYLSSCVSLCTGNTSTRQKELCRRRKYLCQILNTYMRHRFSQLPKLNR